MEKLEIV